MSIGRKRRGNDRFVCDGVDEIAHPAMEDVRWQDALFALPFRLYFPAWSDGHQVVDLRQANTIEVGAVRTKKSAQSVRERRRLGPIRIAPISSVSYATTNT